MSLHNRLNDAIRVVPDFPKPGILFKDITPIFLDSRLVHDAVLALAEPFKQDPPDVVLGIESRGFLLGVMLAQELGCGFALVRKKGKLPGETVAVSYALEYGEAVIEVQKWALKPGQRALVHDDLLATGGTALAAAELAHMLGAHVMGYNFLVSLDFLPGRQRIADTGAPIHTILREG